MSATTAAGAETNKSGQNSQRTAFSFSFEQLEKAAKSSVLAIAGLYGLGLIVANQHLMRLGVTDFSAVKPKYVLTGIVTVTTVLLAVAPALVIGLSSTLNSIPLATRRAYSTVALIAIAGVYILLPFLLQVGLRLSSTIIRALVLVLLLNAVIGIIFMVWNRSRSDSAPSRFQFALALGSPILLILLLAVLANVVEPVYYHIPEAFGGGRPVTAQLSLTEAGKIFWKEQGLYGSKPPTTNTDPVFIFYQNEHELAITLFNMDGLPAKEKIIILDRSLVDGIFPRSNAFTVRF